LQNIFDTCGLTITRYTPVHGGDINQCYCLHTHDAKYFLKVNNAFHYPGMFAKEANGLQALVSGLPTFEKLPTLVVPQVIKYGTVEQQQYLLLDWLEAGRSKPGFWENFGTALATIHRQNQPYYGWEEDNFIGSLVQYNNKHSSWPVFFSECRIMPLVQLLFNNGSFTKQDVLNTGLFCKKTKELFPHEPPSLLHGDLWSGNFMTTAKGDAAIYDPAVYYGHREMDIGMTKLFGGFDPRFYDAYSEAYPLEKNWLRRLPLTQLYPLLVHAILFGGHYVGSAKDIIKQFS